MGGGTPGFKHSGRPHIVETGKGVGKGGKVGGDRVGEKSKNTESQKYLSGSK
jgi:hypothetical protein